MGGTWRLSLNVGREPGTYMPEDWAASGARLAFPVDVEFTTAASTQFAFEELLGAADGTCRLRVLGPGKFIGSSGEVSVECKHGAWRATPTGAGGESHLRFFLDFPEDATRNDVVLPAGRLFFTTGCWQATELELAEQALKELEEAISELDTSWAATREEGEKANVLRKAAIFREGVTLSEKRQMLVAQLRAVASSMPGPSGTVDGPPGLKVGKVGGLSVKRKRGLGEAYFMLGTFSMASIELQASQEEGGD